MLGYFLWSVYDHCPISYYGSEFVYWSNHFRGDGSSIKYSNGVITDCALQPGDVGTFSVAVDVPRGAKYEYETYDILYNLV